MSFRSYLKKHGVTCTVNEFMAFTKKHKQTIYKDYKENIEVINTHIEEWKGRK